MIDKLLMKNEIYKNKVEEVERLKKEINTLKSNLSQKDRKIKELSEIVESREKFRFIFCLVAQMYELETRIPRISKKEKMRAYGTIEIKFIYLETN